MYLIADDCPHSNNVDSATVTLSPVQESNSQLDFEVNKCDESNKTTNYQQESTGGDTQESTPMETSSIRNHAIESPTQNSPVNEKPEGIFVDQTTCSTNEPPDTEFDDTTNDKVAVPSNNHNLNASEEATHEDVATEQIHFRPHMDTEQERHQEGQESMFVPVTHHGPFSESDHLTSDNHSYCRSRRESSQIISEMLDEASRSDACSSYNNNSTTAPGCDLNQDHGAPMSIMIQHHQTNSPSSVTTSNTPPNTNTNYYDMNDENHHGTRLYVPYQHVAHERPGFSEIDSSFPMRPPATDNQASCQVQTTLTCQCDRYRAKTNQQQSQHLSSSPELTRESGAHPDHATNYSSHSHHHYVTYQASELSYCQSEYQSVQSSQNNSYQISDYHHHQGYNQDHHQSPHPLVSSNLESKTHHHQQQDEYFDSNDASNDNNQSYELVSMSQCQKMDTIPYMIHDPSNNDMILCSNGDSQPSYYTPQTSSSYDYYSTAYHPEHHHHQQQQPHQLHNQNHSQEQATTYNHNVHQNQHQPQPQTQTNNNLSMETYNNNNNLGESPKTYLLLGELSTTTTITTTDTTTTSNNNDNSNNSSPISTCSLGNTSEPSSTGDSSDHPISSQDGINSISLINDGNSPFDVDGHQHQIIMDHDQQLEDNFDPLVCEDLFMGANSYVSLSSSNCNGVIEHCLLPQISNDYDPTDDISECLMNCRRGQQLAAVNRETTGRPTRGRRNPNQMNHEDEDDEEEDDDSDYDNGSVDTNSSIRTNCHQIQRTKVKVSHGRNSSLSNGPRCSAKTLEALKRMLQMRNRTVINNNSVNIKNNTKDNNIPNIETPPLKIKDNNVVVNNHNNESNDNKQQNTRNKNNSVNRPLTRSYTKFNGGFTRVSNNTTED